MSRGLRQPASGESGRHPVWSALAHGYAVCLAVVAGVLTSLAPGAAVALEPVSVTLEVRIPIGPDDVTSTLRRRAEAQALEDAVVEVASRYVSPERIEPESPALRQALSSRASAFVLTYRVDGQPVRRTSELDPLVDEFVMSLTVTVDAEQVREALAQLGMGAAAAKRAKIAVACTLAPDTSADARFALTPLRQILTERLDAAGFAIVEPALFGLPDAAARDAVALARAAGSDVGIVVQVGFRALPAAAPGTAQGGVAEVRAVALRGSDGVEVAAARIEAPGYGDSVRDAFLRAVEALGGKLADELVTELGANAAMLRPPTTGVRLRLSGVRSLVEVEVVQQTLLTVLGAKTARVAWLGPGSAELVVDASLTAAELRERLMGAAYPSFALELVELSADRLELRVAEPPAVQAPLPDASLPDGRRASPSAPF
jgi:hypothetical protein